MLQNQNLKDRVKPLLPFLTVPTVFFDLESTGTDPQTARVCSICAILVFPLNQADPMLNPMKVLKTLVNPGVPIPAEATAVHGITNEMVATEPVFSALAPAIHEFFTRAGCIAGYNILKYDLPLLQAEYDRVKMEAPFTTKSLIWDFMAVYRKLFPNTLSAVYERFYGETFEGAHEAETDVLATAAVAAKMFEIGNGTAFKWETPESIQEFAADGKALVDFAGNFTLIDNVVCWTFGKHKDKPLATTKDDSYINWYLTNPGFSPASKAIARAILYPAK